MLFSLVTLLALVPATFAYQPNENIVFKDFCPGSVSVHAYCGFMNITASSTFNMTGPEVLKFKVFNATFATNKRDGIHSKNISDVPIYTKTLQPSDYTLNPSTGQVTYTWIVDVPAANQINAYLYDSQDRQLFFPYILGHYIARSASYWAAEGRTYWGGRTDCRYRWADPFNATTCNRTRFDASNPQLPFDEGSTVAFDKLAWTNESQPVPYGGAQFVMSGPGSSWMLLAGAGVLAAMGTGLSL